MGELTLIYVDRLHGNTVEKIDVSLSPSYLELEEKELHFTKPIHCFGECYATESHLIFHFSVESEAEMPCSICNNPTKLLIEVKGFYHTEPLSEIHKGLYDFKELIREAVLLEIPSFVECQEGKCPSRKEMEPYLSHKPKKGKDEEYFPFTNLKL